MKIDKDQPISANQSLREPCHSVCFIMVLVNVYLRYVLCNNHMTIQRVSTVLYAVKMSFVVCFPFPWDYLKSHVGKITTRKLNIPAQIERHLILSSPWKKSTKDCHDCRLTRGQRWRDISFSHAASESLVLSYRVSTSSEETWIFLER